MEQQLKNKPKQAVTGGGTLGRARFLILAFAAAAAVSAAPVAHAALITEYTFTNRDPSNVAPGVVASTFSTSATNERVTLPGGTTPSLDDRGDEGFNSTMTTAEALAKAVADDDYHEFTISAAAGLIDFENLIINHRVGGTIEKRGFAVRTNQDTYGSNVYWLQDGAATSMTDITVDLSSLAPAASTTFRIYTYVTGTDFSRQQLFNNIAVNAIVPEPASGILFLTASGALMMRRRRSA